MTTLYIVTLLLRLSRGFVALGRGAGEWRRYVLVVCLMCAVLGYSGTFYSMISDIDSFSPPIHEPWLVVTVEHEAYIMAVSDVAAIHTQLQMTFPASTATIHMYDQYSTMWH